MYRIARHSTIDLVLRLKAKQDVNLICLNSSVQTVL